jgi:hypothetical protein
MRAVTKENLLILGSILACFSICFTYIAPILFRKESFFEETIEVQEINISTVNNSGNCVISGDTVYWENDYANLSVTPHTHVGLINHQQIAKLRWNWSDTNIDVVFRFPTQLNPDKDIWLWQNVSYLSKYYLNNISDYSPLGYTPSKVDYGDIPSDYYYNVTICENVTDCTYYIVGFDSMHWINPEQTNATFNYTVITKEWVSQKHRFLYTTDYGKHDYYITDVPVKQGETYIVKWRYGLPIGSGNGKWELMAKLSSETISEALVSGHYCMIDPWWGNGEWLYRKWIEIDYNQVPSDLEDFPVLVYNSSDNDLKAHARSDGNDIAFVKDDNAQLNHEIEVWNSSNGNIVAWVNVTQVNSSSPPTGFWMYYGNNSASNQENVVGTWNTSRYIHVWHMNGTTDGTIYDSTGNNDSVSNSGESVSGWVGNATKFISANSDYVNFGDMNQPCDGVLANVTFEFYGNSSNDDSIFMSKYVTTPETERRYYVRITDNKMRGYLADGDSGDYWYYDTDNVVHTNDSLAYMVFAYDAVAEYITMYYNGTIKPATNIHPDPDVEDFFKDGTENDELGTISNLSLYSDMICDEFRISKVNASGDWIEATYNTISNRSGVNSFCDYGSEQSGIATTSVDEISPYWQDGSSVSITASTDTGTPDNVTLWYRWSDDNNSWGGGNWAENNDTIDSNLSDVDGVEDIGVETDFQNCQDTSVDSDVMTLVENNTGSQYYNDSVDDNLTDVDGYADNGTESDFGNAQDISPDADYMTLTEIDYGFSGAEEWLDVNALDMSDEISDDWT